MNLETTVLMTVSEFPGLTRAKLTELAQKIYEPEPDIVYLAAINRVMGRGWVHRRPDFTFEVTAAGKRELDRVIAGFRLAIERYRGAA